MGVCFWPLSLLVQGLVVGLGSLGPVLGAVLVAMTPRVTSTLFRWQLPKFLRCLSLWRGGGSERDSMPCLVASVITRASDEGDGILGSCPQLRGICWVGLGQAFGLSVRCSQGFGLERGKNQEMARQLTTDSWATDITSGAWLSVLLSRVSGKTHTHKTTKPYFI